MALTLAAAALGAAVIGAGATAYSASQSRKAANNANDAQQAAANQQLTEQRAVRDQAFSLQQPFIQGGYGAFDALLQEYGIRPQGQGGGIAGAPGSSGPQTYGPQGDPTRFNGGFNDTGGSFGPSGPRSASQPPQGPRLDGQRYFEDNDDVEANYWQILQEKGADAPELGGARSPAEYAQVHYQAYGRNEDREAPMLPSPQEPPKVPSDTAARPPGPEAPPAPVRPDAPQAPTFDRPADLAVPQYERPADLQAPGFRFNPQDFLNEAGLKFRINEGNNAVNAASAARGKLRSGDAVKALQERAQGVASEEYGNAFNRALSSFGANESQRQYGQNRLDTNFNTDRNYGTNLWSTQQGRQDQAFRDDRSYGTNLWQYGVDRGDRNFNNDRDFTRGTFEDDRNFSRGVFENDRGFAANRDDTRVNNLFRIAGYGQAGAGAVTGAGQTFANNAGTIYGNQADATSQNAYARANANNQTAGAIANAAGNLFSYNWGGAGGGGVPLQSANWGGGIVPGSGAPVNVPGVVPFRPPVF